MSLPLCGTSPAQMAEKKRIAFDSGERVVELIKKDITPRKIMTKNAFENAIRVDLALGGSSNTVLHLLAIAHEAGVELPLSEFDRLSKTTPHIASLEPVGDHYMEDLHWAGGIGAVLKRLGAKVKENQTVSGKRTKAIVKDVGFINEEVLRPLNKPFHKEGGIAVLKGNIAPLGAVVKQSGVSAKMMRFKGKARCFNSEAKAMSAIMGGKVKGGRGPRSSLRGAKRRPGMREMLAPTAAIVGMGSG